MTTARRTESESVRKEQILNAARKVLDEKGYDSATVSDIVKEAGVAQGTFYLYFSSKIEAVMELGQQVMTEMARTVAQRYDSQMSFEEHMRMLVRTGFEVAHENADLCRLLHVGAESVGYEFKQRMIAEQNPFMTGLFDMFQRGIERGEVIDIEPELAVRLLTSIMSAAMHEAHVSGNDEDAVIVGKVMEELLVNAFTRR